MAAAARSPLLADDGAEAAWSRRPLVVTKWSNCSNCPDLAPLSFSGGARRKNARGPASAGTVRLPARFLVISVLVHALAFSSVNPFRLADESPKQPSLHARLVYAAPATSAAVAPPPAAAPQPRPARTAAERRPERLASHESRVVPQMLAAPAAVPASVPAAAAAAPAASEVAPADGGAVVLAAAPAVPSSRPPPAPTPEQPPALDMAALDAYARTLSGEVAKQRRYPAVARMRGWQGTAVLAITLSPDGAVLKSTLSRSSGYAVLDEQALKMVAESSPLPSAPMSLGGRALEIELPVVFTLANS